MKDLGLQTVVAWDLRKLGIHSAPLVSDCTAFRLSTTDPFTAEETEAQTVMCLRPTAGKLRWLELAL